MHLNEINVQEANVASVSKTIEIAPLRHKSKLYVRPQQVGQKGMQRTMFEAHFRWGARAMVRELHQQQHHKFSIEFHT